MDNKVKFKIGEIEFEAEGTEEIIERERNAFLNMIFPAAVEAIVRTRVTKQNTEFIETQDVAALLTEKNDEGIETKDSGTVDVIDFMEASLAAYVGKYKNINDQDFVILAIYYDKMKNGNDSFSSDMVKKYYADARRPKYSNVSQLLSELVKKGLIMDDPESEQKTPKQYVLTSVGEKYAQTFQPKEEADKKIVKSRKQHNKAKSEYDGINVDELNLHKYPELKKLTGFKEKMMMVLYIMTNENKGEWFTVTDILYLMNDVFGETANKDQIAGVFRRQKLWFKPENVEGNKRDVKRRLLNKGIEYAKSLLVDAEA